MSTAIIMTPSAELRPDLMLAGFRNLDLASIVVPNLDKYTKSAEIEVAVSGEQAAEEMFDLTNNPARQAEREAKYGRGPSVSVGDVVAVDGKLFLCCSMGWEKIAASA